MLFPFNYRYFAVFAATLGGCFTNCFPASLPARFARVVEAYSAALRLLIAASGRYRSPVLLDGFPLLVLHFWSVQFLREACGAFNLCSPRLRPYISWQAIVLFSRSIALPPYPALLNS
jgi:hypothetical protein